MTTTFEAVRTKLVADAAVTALVGTRIYANKAPDNATAPYVVAQLISDVPESSLTGTVSDAGSFGRLQVDCYAKTYLAAHAVAAAIDAVVGNLAFTSLSAWRIDKRDLYDDATELHRASVDFSVWR